MTKQCREKILRLNFFYFDEFRGPLKGALSGPKGLKAAVLVIETEFLVSRLSVTK